MTERLSPGCTATTSGGRVVVGAPRPGMVSRWPIWSRSGSVIPFSRMRADWLTPWAAAISERLSPDRTTTTVGPLGRAAPDAPGTRSSWPTYTESGSVMPLASTMAATVTPWCAAMPDRLSPDCTTTTRGGSVVGVAPAPGTTSSWPM